MQAKRKIEVVPYNWQWTLEFKQLSQVIKERIGQLILRIEHVGSTSVPRLAAKPILDIDVVIGSNVIFPQICDRLTSLGYKHVGDLGIKGREAFLRDAEDVPRNGTQKNWMSHHLYVCDLGSRELSRHLHFRNYLKSHPEAAAEYSNLKQQLAIRFPYDIDSYIEGKTTFVESILEKAGWIEG